MSLSLSFESEPCPTCGHSKDGVSFTITHNLGAMADAAGIYGLLWHPSENGIERAKQLIAPLRTAIAEMKANPTRFKKHDSPNGWGLYENFVPWLEGVLMVCEVNPRAVVHADR